MLFQQNHDPPQVITVSKEDILRTAHAKRNRLSLRLL